MNQLQIPEGAQLIASRIHAEIRALPLPNTPSVRAVRRRYTQQLRAAAPRFVLDLADELLGRYDHRWVAYELIQAHRPAFESLGPQDLEALGRGIDSWWTVDAFARTLAGPAWLRGQVPDALIHRWACSPDLWWRRAALVSTVALNVRSKGGQGDVPKTLAVCRLLVSDHQDMVVKALSWALRELVVHDPAAVRAFLSQHDGSLAGRVKREVWNKLETGLKTPRPQEAERTTMNSRGGVNIMELKEAILKVEQIMYQEIDPIDFYRCRSGLVVVDRSGIQRGQVPCPFCGELAGMGVIEVRHDDGRAVYLDPLLFHLAEVGHPITDQDVAGQLLVDIMQDA